MAELRYGHVEGPHQGREYPVAASQYFHRRGGKFVYIASGNVNICASANGDVMGWAEVPKHTEGYDSWLSSSTAGKDSVFVVYGLNDLFEIPYNTTVTTSLIGRKVGIIHGGSTATDRTVDASSMQMAALGVSASPLEVVDVNTDTDTLLVRISPDNKQ